MPEMNYSKKLRGWSLRDAEEAGQLLEVTCHFCRTTYRYFPRDLLKLTSCIADIDIEDGQARRRDDIARPDVALKSQDWTMERAWQNNRIAGLPARDGAASPPAVRKAEINTSRCVVEMPGIPPA